MDKQTALEQLVQMSLNLGLPENDYVILGEGNTSAKIDDETFYVKASGTYLSTASRESFVEVRSKDILRLLDEGDKTDEEIKDALNAAAVNSKLRPSVETTFHSFLLSLPNVNFVGHTHPAAVNGILCSGNAHAIYQGRIFPDEIVYCGIRPVYIPYVDPGLKLARAIRTECLRFMDEYDTVPKVILMQNHGFIALGSTAKDVEAVTAMGVKTARVLATAMACGGVHYFTRENVDRIYSRPDEHYRQQVQAMLAGR